MKSIIFAVLFLILSNNLFAQNLTHTLGISASSISGAGFSYKYKINEDWTVKSTSFIIGNKINENESNIYLNLGSEIQKNLYQTKKSRLYLLGGGSYWYSRENFYDDKYIDENLNLGFALGMEFIAFDNISFNVDFGYHLINYLNDSNFLIGFGGGAGIGYTFGK